MMSLTPEQWDRIKPEMQLLIKSALAAKIYMFTVLVAKHPTSRSLREFRQHLRDTSDWDKPGLLVIGMVFDEGRQDPR